MRARALRGHRRILLDTSIWIYHFERNARFSGAAGMVIGALEAGEFAGVSSELVLLEVTVGPLRLGRQDVADEYELLLNNFPNLSLRPVTREILLDAVALRAEFRLKTPDAIMAATGLRAGATAAVTNDDSWRDLPGMKVFPLETLR